MYKKITRHAVACSLLVLSCGLYAQSPGGVARQSLWLKGNFFADTTHLSALNFNPATTIGNGTWQTKISGDIQNLKRATIFTVYQNGIAEQEIPVWQIAGGFGDIMFSTTQLSSKSGKTRLLFEKPAASSPGQVKTGSFISTYIKQGRLEPTTEPAEQNEGMLMFGNKASLQPGSQSPGMVAEFIMYETILKEKDIARIETYLALKYGITLEKNYVNSLDKTIWNRKTNEPYSNNIAGIGRDDHSTLYQRQGTSSGTSDQLIIGVNKIAPANDQNTGHLNDRDYLIWGDNGQPFTLNHDANPRLNGIVLSRKKWLIKAVGSTANTISTELKIDTKKLLSSLDPIENFYLAIDRSGSGGFDPKNCTYILADSISAEGIAVFSGLQWNTKGAGQNVFSFGVKSTLSTELNTGKDFSKLNSFRVYPNPSTDGRYNIAVTLKKKADLTIEVYDIHLRLLESRKLTGRSDYLVPGYITTAAGAYLIKLFTVDKEFSKIIIKQ